jgi:hypothetical protein
MLSRTSVLALIASAGFCALAACGNDSAPGTSGHEPDHEAADVHAEEDHVHEDADADHDHDTESDGAGEVHVHGIADVALTREGDVLTAELIAPLANFGLSESDGEWNAAALAGLPSMFELDGGGCKAGTPHPMINAKGTHSEGIVHFVWTCSDPGSVKALRFTGFEAFPGFEKVSAIYITDTDQKAGELSPSAPALSLK